MTSVQGRRIENLPLLDLSHITSAEDLAGIEEIRNVAAVVVPDSLSPALTGVRMRNVGAVVPVPTGARVRVHTGTVLLGGDALADPANEDVVLFVTGSLVITSPVTKVTFREIVVTGTVLAPKGSESALGAGLTRVTGEVNYYRHAEGQEFRQLTGQVRISGESLANTGGSPDDVLLLAGQVIVTSPVESVGYQRIFYTGQLVLPRASEAVLASVLSGSGQVAWYTGQPRFFLGKDVLSRGFFELVEEPIAIAVVGSLRIDDDVPAELLRAKVSEVTLVGELTAPRELLPVLQLLTTERYGAPRATGEDEEEQDAEGEGTAGDDAD